MSFSTMRRIHGALTSPVAVVVQTMAVVHCVNQYAFAITTCAGPSMLPTFNTAGDVLFVDKYSAWTGRIRPGDVVIASSPQNAKQMICKRIVAMEGQTWYHRGMAEVVPAGHVWLEGDNASNSTDSRYYGPVSLAMVRGKVFFKAWPLTEFGPVASYVPDDGSDDQGDDGMAHVTIRV